MNSDNKTQTIDEIRILINNYINKLQKLYNTDHQSILTKAIQYTLMSKGKRIRGLLLIGCADIFNTNRDHALILSTIIEMVHTYSLIHDDLPAMDNSDMRREQPSCHKKFDEATAILTGNALLSLSFELLSSCILNISCAKKCIIIYKLSKSIGPQGIIGGQILDIAYKNKNIDEINIMKTGKLFIAACEIGAILGNANNKEINIIKEYAKNIGIAFQIIDDIHDKKYCAENIIIQTNKAKKLLTNANNIVKKFNKNTLLNDITAYITSALLTNSYKY